MDESPYPRTGQSRFLNFAAEDREIEMNLRDKVVIVTGASQGLGEAVARELQKKGALLSLSALPEPGFEERAGDRCLVTPGDLTDGRVRSSVVERTLDRFGRVDALINNAGVGLYAPPSIVDLDLARRLYELNVFAPLALAQLVIPHFRRQGSGSIVNIGSVGGFVSLPWAVMYCSSKFALHAISDSLRRELSQEGIHVMKVCPGIIETKFRDHVLAGHAPARVTDIKRVVTPEQVARGVVRGMERRSRTVYVPWIGKILLVPKLNLRMSGVRLPQCKTVAETQQNAGRIQILCMLQTCAMRGQGCESSTRVPPLVPDSIIERRPQPLVRRSKHNQRSLSRRRWKAFSISRRSPAMCSRTSTYKIESNFSPSGRFSRVPSITRAPGCARRISSAKCPSGSRLVQLESPASRCEGGSRPCQRQPQGRLLSSSASPF